MDEVVPMQSLRPRAGMNAGAKPGCQEAQPGS